MLGLGKTFYPSDEKLESLKVRFILYLKKRERFGGKFDELEKVRGV
jgi:hypothetical protein